MGTKCASLVVAADCIALRAEPRALLVVAVTYKAVV